MYLQVIVWLENCVKRLERHGKPQFESIFYSKAQNWGLGSSKALSWTLAHIHIDKTSPIEVENTTFTQRQKRKNNASICLKLLL